MYCSSGKTSTPGLHPTHQNIVVDGAHPDRNTLPLQNNAPHRIIETTKECFEEFDKDIAL